MTLATDLAERRTEFGVHLGFADALDRRLIEGPADDVADLQLSIRHVLTIKSGLLVHLYNIVEATMTKIIEEIGREVMVTPPNKWSPNALREWLRHYAYLGMDGNEDTRLAVVHGAALKLLQVNPIEKLVFKKPSGTWDDKVILQFARRLGVQFPLNEAIGRRIQAAPKYGDATPLQFLAERRNAIAHGRRSFEDGANDLALPDIRNLSEVTLDYMELAVGAFSQYITDKRFVIADA